MQDTRTLKVKLKKYKSMLTSPMAQDRAWLLDEVKNIEYRIETRNRNRAKTQKQFKKAN